MARFDPRGDFPLRLESLEARLALSHDPAILVPPIASFSPVEANQVVSLGSYDRGPRVGTFDARPPQIESHSFDRAFDDRGFFAAPHPVETFNYDVGPNSALSFAPRQIEVHASSVAALPLGNGGGILFGEAGGNFFALVLRPVEIRYEFIIGGNSASNANPVEARADRPMPRGLLNSLSDDRAQLAPLVKMAEESPLHEQQSIHEAIREFRPAITTIPTLHPIAASPAPTGDPRALMTQPGGIISPQGIVDEIEPLAPLPQPNFGRAGGTAIERNENGLQTAPSSDASRVDGASEIQIVTINPGTIHTMGLLDSGARAALLASLPLNMEAVDQALATMVGEVELLGGELVSWLDDASLPPWAVAATFVGACGLGARYLRFAQARKSVLDDGEEESSSWLFTRLQSPAGKA